MVGNIVYGHSSNAWYCISYADIYWQTGALYTRSHDIFCLNKEVFSVPSDVNSTPKNLYYFQMLHFIKTKQGVLRLPDQYTYCKVHVQFLNHYINKFIDVIPISS